jgi:hypothetical protein
LPKAVRGRCYERGGQPRDFDVMKQVSTPMANHPVYVCFFFPCRFDWKMAFYEILVFIATYYNSYPVIQICRNLVDDVDDLPNLRLK